MNVTNKIELEIVNKLIADILAAGYRIAVSTERGYDIGEMLMGSTDPAKIIEEAFSAGESHLFIQPATGPMVSDGGAVVSDGWVYLIPGNGNYIISDYSVRLEHLLEGANAIADQYE